MNVYANHFRIEGKEAYEASIRAIHGWLRQKIGNNLQISDITRDGEYKNKSEGRSTWLRNYSCTGEDPSLHAWRLKHNDTDVRGRQWVVELGLKVEPNAVEFSCAVQTDDQSTLVRDPVFASRPRIIGFMLKNINQADASIAPSVPGQKVQYVGTTIESYEALKHEIERTERDYPLVLVSPNRAGEYLINREHLQESLFGLAQVIEVHPDFNSYEMEENLGRFWSAWDGAINILHTPMRDGRVRGALVRSNEVEELGEDYKIRASYLLARVTHNTNIPRLRMRIRPEGVAQLAMRRRLDAKRKVLSTEGASISKDELSLLWTEIEDLSDRLKSVEDERDSTDLLRMQLEDEKLEIEHKYRQLQYRSRESEKLETSNDTQLVEPLLRLACSPSQPTPEECLEILDQLYGGQCIILPSAYDSAKESSMFEHGRRLLDMLRRLATSFHEALQSGGDSQAKLCFTNDEYSATESETVMNNSSLSQCRIFTYKSQNTEMYRHLKIGKADDTRKTIRVHFHWDSADRKIVIGYCGKHLPVATH